MLGICKESTITKAALDAEAAGNVKDLSSLVVLNINIHNFQKDANKYGKDWNTAMSRYQNAKVASYKYIISAIDKNPSWKLDASVKKQYIDGQVKNYQSACTAQQTYDQKLNNLLNGLKDTYYTSILANGASYFRKSLPASFPPLDTFGGLEKEVAFGMSFTCNPDAPKKLSDELDRYIE